MLEFKGLPSITPLRTKFNKLFNLEFNDYWDKGLTLMTNTISFDIIKLDDTMHKLYGDYDVNDDKSMSDLIEEKYGKEAVDFIFDII